MFVCVQSLAAGLPADTDALLETLNTHCKARAEALPARTRAFLRACLILTGCVRAQCTRGAGGAASNYLAFGTSMDWMWQGTCPYLLLLIIRLG
jgi:hypothetical protein